MEIVVTGGYKEQAIVAESCIKWCAEYLLKPSQRKRLLIELEISDECFLVDGNLADVSPDEFGSKPKIFEMRAKQSVLLPDLARAICHEMVHVKQYALGELCDDVKSFVLWYGKRYDNDKVDYHDRPWEWEAIGREEGLYRKWYASQENRPFTSP